MLSWRFHIPFHSHCLSDVISHPSIMTHTFLLLELTTTVAANRQYQQFQNSLPFTFEKTAILAVCLRAVSPLVLPASLDHLHPIQYCPCIRPGTLGLGQPLPWDTQCSSPLLAILRVEELQLDQLTFPVVYYLSRLPILRTHRRDHNKKLRVSRIAPS